MKKKVNTTLGSIAKHLDISVSTVSRALNGKSEQSRISKDTTKLIIETAKKFNYEPNQLARSLRLKKTNTIGIIIPDITNPFFAKIVRWIENEARENGVSVLISDSSENTEIEKSSVQVFANRKIDGLIISPVGTESDHLDDARDKKIPIVLVDRYFKKANFPFIGSDNFNGSKEAVNFLIRNGHKRIGFIQGIRKSSVNRERTNGYKAALKENNISVDSDLIMGNEFGEENGYISAKHLLQLNKKVSSIFASSNQIALGALAAIAEEKLKIPENISVIAFDDQPYSRFLSTPMTTVMQQSKEIGSIAFNLLFEMINSNCIRKISNIKLPTKLVIRDSVTQIN